MQIKCSTFIFLAMVEVKEMTIEEVKSKLIEEFHKVVYDDLENYFDFSYFKTDVDDYYFKYYGQEESEVNDLYLEDGDSYWYADVFFSAGLDYYLALEDVDAEFTAVKKNENGETVDNLYFRIKE